MSAVRVYVLLSLLPLATENAQTVEFPGPIPGAGYAHAADGTFTLSNDVLGVSWRLQGGVLQPVALVNKLAGQSVSQTNSEIFRLSYTPQTTNTSWRFLSIKLGPNSVDARVSVDGATWFTLGSFARADFPGEPSQLRIGKMDDSGQGSDYPIPGDLNECHFDNLHVEDGAGVTLLEETFEALSGDWTIDQSVQPGTQLITSNGLLVVRSPDNCHAFISRVPPATAASFTCSVDRFTNQGQCWAPALCLRWPSGKFVLVGFRTPPNIFNLDSNLTGEQILMNVPIHLDLAASDFAPAGSPEVRASQISPPGGRVGDSLPGQEVFAQFRHANSGIEVDWRAVLRNGANYLRQFITIRSTNPATRLSAVEALDWNAPSPIQRGAVAGSPVVAEQFFFGVELPLAYNTLDTDRVRSAFNCDLPLSETNSYEFSSVVGVYPAGQMRRGFLYYLERERARPSAPMQLYTSWCQMLISVNETNFLSAIDQIDLELTQRRGVPLDSYEIDDGWDNPNAGFWAIDPNKFPHAFTAVRDRAEAAGAQLGLWISPLGGYEPRWTPRTLQARAEGIIPSNGCLNLSYPTYYDWFLNECLTLVESNRLNYILWDLTSDGVSPHTMALLRIADELHRRYPNLYLNPTVGTLPPPFWLNHVESTFRGANDKGWVGVGDKRECYITYRDAQTLRGVVSLSPLYPLNSIVIGGVVYVNTSWGTDLRHDLRTFFGLGSSWQELCIDPSIMTSNNWDQLAEVARWARENSDVLADTHWIGGDPSALAIYGWASWSPRKGILVLRNPSDQTQSIAIDAADAFELPAGAASIYELSTPFPDQNVTSGTLIAGLPTVISLLPFEVLVLEGTPRTSYAEWVSQCFPRNPDPTTTVTDADPDGDGLPNLIEYAFHTNPLNPSGAALFLSAQPTNGVALEFIWNLAATDVSWVIETSTDLESWQPAIVTSTTSYAGAGNLRIRVVTAVSNESRRFYRVRVSQRTSYAEWVSRNFPSNSDPAATMAEADPDHDGLPNLIEYAFHTDPMRAIAAAPVLLTQTNSDMVLEFLWNQSATDASWVIETSTDLESWQPAMVTTTTSYVGAGNLRIRAVSSIGNESRRFYRVRVSL